MMNLRAVVRLFLGVEEGQRGQSRGREGRPVGGLWYRGTSLIRNSPPP